MPFVPADHVGDHMIVDIQIIEEYGIFGWYALLVILMNAQKIDCQYICLTAEVNATFDVENKKR